MTSQQQSVEYLFGEALEREPGARRAFLETACAGSAVLRRQVEELLLADERAGSFLEQPAVGSSAAEYSTTIAAKTPEECGDIELHAALDAPPVRFRVGDRIAARFLVVRFIARGGMGEVYEVEDTLLRNVHVALKIILPQIAGDAGSARRFEQEVLLARRVVHPNLCPIYDISRCTDCEPPFLFMTMRLLTGETLAARLRRGTRILLDDAVAIYRQMVAGVAAIHAGGIVHRDIKPNNVMLERESGRLQVTIMDFGLARLHGAETTMLSQGMVAGTPGYIAPELLRGQCPSRATDVFALGVLMHQVLTGEHPVAKPNTFSTEPSPMLALTDAPPALVEAVREFLADEPGRRLEAFRRARAALEAGTDNSSGIRISRRAFAIGGATAAAVVVGGAAWHFDWIDDLMHPIPAKRFVALLNWPAQVNSAVQPVINGVIDAIHEQLSRAEAFDHNLYVTTHNLSNDLKSPAELNELRDSLGANLVLAASGTTRNDQYHVNLRLLDSSSTHTLRERQVSSHISEQAMLPERAVRAAEHLLNVARTKPTPSNKGGTQSAEAFAAFQEAEALRKQENEAGLEEAIEKYKASIEADPKYALAHAKLALAYLRLYGMSRNSAALELARANARTAIALNTTLTDGYIAMSLVREALGDEQGAFHEVNKALVLDPSNPKTLVYKAQLLTRMNQWDEAEKTYREVLQERPNFWLAYQELGMNFFSQGKYQEALKAFQAASLAAPSNSLTLNNIGAMYQLIGQSELALENLKESVKIKPEGETYSAIANVLRSEERYQEAVQAAQKGVEMSPNNPDVWLELADCYQAIRDRNADAKKAYLRAAREEEAQLRDDPTNGPAWMQLALIKTKLGNPNDAYSLISKAEAFKAGDIDSQIIKARIQELLGNRDGSLATVAFCRKMGATEAQLRSISDLDDLRNDRRYKGILNQTKETH